MDEYLWQSGLLSLAIVAMAIRAADRKGIALRSWRTWAEIGQLVLISALVFGFVTEFRGCSRPSSFASDEP